MGATPSPDGSLASVNGFALAAAIGARPPAAAERIDRLRTDLLLIKAERPAEYERFRLPLGRALEL